MNEEDNILQSIENKYDYSNAIIDIDRLLYLVKYLDNVYKHFKKMIDDDEEKNVQFKNEYKEYMFKKVYSDKFDIYVKYDAASLNTTYNDYEHFASAATNGNIKMLEGIDIKLYLNFKRGKGDNLFEHNNLFRIDIKPYKIIFSRVSDYKDEVMDQIENNIITIMNQFPTVNTIFYSK